MYDSRRLRILLVGEGRADQRIAQARLLCLGHQVNSVSSGLEGLQYMARQHYDVVLLNMEMKEMDGLEVIRIIRESWPASEQPYIIALAECSREYSEESCIKAGADSFMHKPLRAEELEAAICSLKIS